MKIHTSTVVQVAAVAERELDRLRVGPSHSDSLAEDKGTGDV